MVTLLRGLQAGDAEAFTCLYAATNPLLLRYLRVVSGADPAPVALATWSTLLDGIASCAAADDDDWLELVVGTARSQAGAAGSLHADVAVTPDGPGSPVAVAGPEAEPVDDGIAALRACGPAVAEVLAMGVITGLGRDSIARLTGLEPSDVLAHVLDGQTRLAVPLTNLKTTMRAPGTLAELSDLPAVLPLFEAQSHTPLPPADPGASAGTRTVVTLLPWDAPASPPRAGQQHGAVAAASPRSARIGAAATAWTVAIGGVAAAAAMIGGAPAAFDRLFGNGGGGPVVTAQGPIQPGRAPRTNGGPGVAPPSGGPGAGPPSTVRPAGPAGPTGPATPPGPAGAAGAAGAAAKSTSTTGDGAAVSASTAGVVSGMQVVVVSAVFTGSSTTPPLSAQPPLTQIASPQSAPSTQRAPGVTAPRSGSRATTAAGQGHVQRSTGSATSSTMTPMTTSAQTKAAQTKAAQTKAAKAKAAKVKAAKAKAAKAAKAAAAARAAKLLA